MRADPQYSVESARAAAARDELADWVAGFLASRGSDNPLLGQKLSQELRWWIGPIRVPLDRLHRLAGPPGDPVLCPVDEEYWDERVDEIDRLAERGWEPPPVVVTSRDGLLYLEDGNHRVEGVRQAGRRSTWAVIGFPTAEDRDRFMAESAAGDGADGAVPP